VSPTEQHTKIVLDKIVKCDFCKNFALFDAKTKAGQWAWMCKDCYPEKRYYSTLGLGKGQKIHYIINPKEGDPLLSEAMYEYLDRLQKMPEDERREEIKAMLEDA